VFLYGLETDEELAVDLEPGARLYIELETITEPNYHGIRTLLLTVNGQPRR
jgi:pyruvate carboxylase